MINTAATILILILVFTEAYCMDRIATYIKDRIRTRSEEKTEARREAYRAEAYGKMNEINTIKQNRQDLWRSVR